MLTTALVASLLALAPTTDARGRRYVPRVSKPSSGGVTTTTSGSSASAKCIAVATSYNFADSLDAHADATTEAWAYACENPPSDPYWWTHVYEAMRQRLSDHQDGFAFATAIATAETYCRSRGNAWGCAAAYAHAQAWAEADISANANAWAQAIGECECNDKTQTVFAEAENYAYLSERITASVAAVAESYSCVDGDDEAHNYDAQTCVQDIYAVAWARSISRAVIAGSCFPASYYDSSEAGEFLAAAEAEVNVDIEKTEIAGCVDEVEYYTPQYLENYRN